MSTKTDGGSWQDIARMMQYCRDRTVEAVTVPDIPLELPLDVTKLPGSLLTKQDISITKSPPGKLLFLLARQEFGSEAVTSAFLRRSGLAQQLTKCIAELLPEQALQKARHLDDYLSRHETTIGPLRGLPISVREHIGMEDLNHNAGFVS